MSSWMAWIRYSGVLNNDLTKERPKGPNSEAEKRKSPAVQAGKNDGKELKAGNRAIRQGRLRAAVLKIKKQLDPKRIMYGFHPF